jgi:hypothetical protein
MGGSGCHIGIDDAGITGHVDWTQAPGVPECARKDRNRRRVRITATAARKIGCIEGSAAPKKKVYCVFGMAGGNFAADNSAANVFHADRWHARDL